VMIYTNPTKNWVWWSTRTPPKTGCDDGHLSHQKLGVMIYTNPTKNWEWWFPRTPQKLNVMIYMNPIKNWMGWFWWGSCRSSHPVFWWGSCRSSHPFLMRFV
jgi:hypothetical protein